MSVMGREIGEHSSASGKVERFRHFSVLPDAELYNFLTQNDVTNGNCFEERSWAAEILVGRNHKQTFDTLKQWLEDPTLGVRSFIGIYFTGGPTDPREYPDPKPDSTPDEIARLARRLIPPSR